MTERTLVSGFLFDFKKHTYFYLLRDSGRAEVKKPFDFFFIYDGRHCAVEAKKEEGIVKEHQKKGLSGIEKSGGCAFVARFRHNGKHARNVVFYPFIGGSVNSKFSVWFEYNRGYQLEDAARKLIHAFDRAKDEYDLRGIKNNEK